MSTIGGGRGSTFHDHGLTSSGSRFAFGSAQKAGLLKPAGGHRCTQGGPVRGGDQRKEAGEMSEPPGIAQNRPAQVSAWVLTVTAVTAAVYSDRHFDHERKAAWSGFL